MTLDPQLTIIRTRDAGAEFYDDVVARIRGTGTSSPGMMFHFSGSYLDEFFAVSAYKNQAASTEMFAEFTGPHFASAVGAGGGGPDIARDEFEIFSFAIRGDEDLQGFRFTEPGEFVAVLVTNPDITPESYLATTEVANFPADWPEGMVIHVVSVFGNHLGVFDLWRANADRSEFYGGRITSAIAEATELDPAVGDNPSAIELHSLYIDSGSFEGHREYLREERPAEQ
jgi:hypothetical protein